MIATATKQQIDAATPNPWSAVGAMTLCVAMLIASEFHVRQHNQKAGSGKELGIIPTREKQASCPHENESD